MVVTLRRVGFGAAFLAAMACGATAAEKTCGKELDPLQDFARKVSVAVDAPTPGAGEPIEIRWQSQAGVYPGPSRVYLVVASIDAVRFAGGGFLPYPGGAAGPAGVRFAQEWMRAVVPLHIKDNPTTGSYAVKAFREGNFGLSWAVVAATPCGEVQLGETQTFRTRVESRRAAIVLQDLYDYTEPETVIDSLDGKYRLLVFDGYYQVFVRETGAKIIDRRGYCPDFSPTGRFVAALTGKFDGECVFNTSGQAMPKFEVADLVSGAIVARVDPPVLWALKDTYLVTPTKWWKMLQGRGRLINLLVDPEPGSAPVELPENAEVRLALDDGVVIFTEDDSAIEAVDLLTRHPLVDQHLADSPNAGEADTGPRTAVRLDETRRLTVDDVPALADHPQVQVSHTRYITDFPSIYTDVQNAERMLPRAVVHDVATGPDARQLLFAGEDGGVVLAAGATRGAVPILDRKSVGRSIEALVSDLLGTTFTLPDSVMVLGNDFRKVMWEIDAMKIEDDEKLERFEKLLANARAEMRQQLIADATQAAGTMDQWMGCWPNGDKVGNNLSGAWRWRQGSRTVWLVHASCQEIGTVGDLAVNRLDLYMADASGSRHFNLLHDEKDASDESSDPDQADPDAAEDPSADGDDEFSAQFAEPQQYEVLSSAETGKPAKLDGSVHQAVQEMSIYPVFVSDRFILIPVTDSIYIVDHKNLTLLGPVPLTSPSDGSRFVATADGRYFMQVTDHDGSLAIYEFATGKQVLGGRSIDDELIVFEPNGYYASTQEGAQFVHLRFAGRPELYSLSQMATTLHRPDIVKAALSRPASVPADMLMVPPPTLGVALHEAGITGESSFRVQSSSEAGLKEIRLYRDGSLASTLPATGTQFTSDVPTALALGANWLTVVAVDVNGLESRPRSIALVGNRAGGDRPKLFVVAVGTDVYAESARLPRLRYAAADAKRFAASVAQLKSSLYGAVEVVATLADSQDLETELESALARIAREAGPRDTVMLFFAGHGVRDGDGRFFLATRTTEIQRLAATALSWSSIALRLSGLKSRIFVFIDSCHAGSVEQVTNDGAVEAFIGGTEGSVTVIAASKGRQSSFESSVQGGGYFTTALVSAFAGYNQASMDIDASGSLDLDELYLTLKKQVVRATAGRQTPWIARSQVVGKAPMF